MIGRLKKTNLNIIEIYKKRIVNIRKVKVHFHVTTIKWIRLIIKSIYFGLVYISLLISKLYQYIFKILK